MISDDVNERPGNEPEGDPGSGCLGGVGRSVRHDPASDIIAAARQDLDAREREAGDRVMKEEMQRQLDSTRRSMIQPLAR